MKKLSFIKMINLKFSPLFTFRILSLFTTIFFINACKELDKIDYIQFKAGFVMPNIAREDENVFFQPSESTETQNKKTGVANAQSFSWSFGDNETSNEKNPTHIYKKFGTYNIKFKAQILKQEGTIIDSTTKKITILPKLNTPTATFTYGGTRDETIYEVLPIVDGSGYWAVGRRGITDIWIHKLDNDFKAKTGFPKIIESFSTALTTPKDIATTTDGGLIIVGEIRDSPQDRDAFVVKIDAEADEEWFEVTSSLKDEYYVGVFQNKTGNYTVVGTSYSGSSNDINITTDIYNNLGEKINTVLSVNASCKCEAQSIFALNTGSPTDNDNFLVAGTTRNNVPAIMYAFGNGTSGNYSLLSNSDSENFKGQGTTVLPLSDGRFILAGYLNNTTDTDRKDAFVAKFDNINGSSAAWRNRFRMYSDEFKTLLEDADKNIIAVGNHSNPISVNDVFLVKYDNNTGKLLQSKTFGTQVDEQVFQAIYTNQNKIVIVGLQKTTETIPQRNNAWLMQLDENW